MMRWWLLEYLGGKKFVLASESNLSPATWLASWKASLKPWYPSLCFKPSWSPQSVFYTDPVNWHKQCLSHRYERQHVFFPKTRSIILFTNTTLNHLGFGGTATKHFHFPNDETEDMLVHNMQPNYSCLFVPKVVHVLWKLVCKVLKCHQHWLGTLNKQLVCYSSQ